MVEVIEFEHSEAASSQAPASRLDLAGRMFEGYPDLMTPAETAQAMGLGLQAVRRYIKRGTLPGKKISGRYYVPKIALAELVLNGETV